MDVTNIPFAKHIGIEYKDEGMLKLDATEVVQNPCDNSYLRDSKYRRERKREVFNATSTQR